MWSLFDEASPQSQSFMDKDCVINRAHKTRHGENALKDKEKTAKSNSSKGF